MACGSRNSFAGRVPSHGGTGFVIGILFLERHGFEFKASEEGATQAVMELAEGTVDESGFAQWLGRSVTRSR